MIIQDLNDVKELFASLSGTFVGVGMTAFPRITPAYFLDPYYIVSLRNTCDIPLLKEKAVIFCLEQGIGGPIWEKGLNSARLLSHPLVRQFFSQLPGPKHVLLYQNYPELETLAKQEGWVLLANPAALRIRVAEKAFFKKMTADLHLPMIPGEIHPIEVIHAREYEYWLGTIGPRLVIQLPDIHQGGGKGTFFIDSPSEYQGLRERLKANTWRGVSLKSVSIHKFMEGISVSIALCITRQGALLSGLQRQLIDLPYCKGLPESGVFCGHVWGETPWPASVTEEVRKQARMIGDYLASLGYKGILGIDFQIDEGRKRVYPLEINPRFTGVFPMLSLLFIRNQLIPLEVFHMLELLGISYQADIEGLNATYAEPINGSHMLLFLLSEGIQAPIKRLKAGLYEFDPDEEKVSFIKEAFEYREIRNERQFIIVDGPPDTGGGPMAVSDPLHRLCRLLFSYPVVNGSGVLSRRSLNTVDWVYGRTLKGTS